MPFQFVDGYWLHVDPSRMDLDEYAGCQMAFPDKPMMRYQAMDAMLRTAIAFQRGELPQYANGEPILVALLSREGALEGNSACLDDPLCNDLSGISPPTSLDALWVGDSRSEAERNVEILGAALLLDELVDCYGEPILWPLILAFVDARSVDEWLLDAFWLAHAPPVMVEDIEAGWQTRLLSFQDARSCSCP